jgi:hypothetical protein
MEDYFSQMLQLVTTTKMTKHSDVSVIVSMDKMIT